MRARTLVPAFAVGIVCLFSGELYSETTTTTFTFPSPAGVYRRLITTAKTILARDSDNVGIGTSDPAEKLEVNGNIALSLSRDTTAYRVINVASPIAPTDAVNKDYVDAAAGGAGTYTAWGVDTCAAGWTVAYAGAAAAPMAERRITNNAVSVGVGGSICAAGPITEMNRQFDSQLFWLASLSGGFNGGLKCAVCVK